MYQRRSRVSIKMLILLGLMAGLGFFVYDNLPRLGQGSASTTIDAPPSTTQAAIAATTAPISTATPDAPRTAALFMPTSGVYAPVVEVFVSDGTWDVSRLGEQVGHLQGTAWFDEPGNVVLSGHVELADGRAGVFANLDSIQIDDPIIIESNGQQMHYIVTAISQTAPDDLEPVRSTSDDRLTLITCSEYDFIQDSYSLRTIVVAQRTQ